MRKKLFTIVRRMIQLFQLMDTVLLDKMLDLLKFILAFAIPGGTFLGATKIWAKEVIQGRAAMKLSKDEISKLGDSDEIILDRLNDLSVKFSGMEQRTEINRQYLEEMRDDFREFQREVRKVNDDNTHNRRNH